MPRLLKLMFHVPMSSPQMTRMFGFFACARAAGAATAAKTRARTVQSEPRNRCKRGGVFMVILDSNAEQWPEGSEQRQLVDRRPFGVGTIPRRAPESQSRTRQRGNVDVTKGEVAASRGSVEVKRRSAGQLREQLLDRGAHGFRGAGLLAVEEVADRVERALFAH